MRDRTYVAPPAVKVYACIWSDGELLEEDGVVRIWTSRTEAVKAARQYFDGGRRAPPRVVSATVEFK